MVCGCFVDARFVCWEGAVSDICGNGKGRRGGGVEARWEESPGEGRTPREEKRGDVLESLLL